MFWCVSPWVYPVWDSLHLLDLIISFSMLGKFSTITSSKIFSYPFFSFSFSGMPIIRILVHLILSQRSLRLSCSFQSFYFILLLEVISTILSYSSLIHSSASDILLLITSRVFLILVIVLLVCLFFNSSPAAVAKSFQSGLTLCDPIEGSPSGSPVPGIL